MKVIERTNDYSKLASNSLKMKKSLQDFLFHDGMNLAFSKLETTETPSCPLPHQRKMLSEHFVKKQRHRNFTTLVYFMLPQKRHSPVKMWEENLSCRLLARQTFRVLFPGADNGVGINGRGGLGIDSLSEDPPLINIFS